MNEPRYEIREYGRSFSVYAKRREVIREKTVDGVTKTEIIPWSNIFRGDEPSVFDARHSYDDVWDVDLDAGALRWAGTRTTKEIRKALRNCGFDTPTINKLLKKYKNQGD